MKDIKWMGVNGQKPTVKGKASHPHLPTRSISNRLLDSSILESNQVFSGLFAELLTVYIYSHDKTVRIYSCFSTKKIVSRNDET
ncbi:hypothetical protein EMIT0194P_40388 [Pseudomonas serbica]